MNHIMRAIAVVAIMGLMAAPAWAGSQHGQPSQGSQRSITADYIVGATPSAAQSVQQVHFRRGLVGRPYYFGERHYYGPRYYGYYGGPWRYGSDYGPWRGYRHYGYYGGGVRVGPVDVWW